MATPSCLVSRALVITRSFAHQLPKTTAMTVASVGSCGELGCVMGGFLFDVGGLALPWVMRMGQVSIGLLGFRFDEIREAKEAMQSPPPTRASRRPRHYGI